jgi:hypothetical protein
MQIHAVIMIGWFPHTSSICRIGVPPRDSQHRTRVHAIRYQGDRDRCTLHLLDPTVNLSSKTGGPPLTISNTVPVAQSGDFTQGVTNPLSLEGIYNAQSLSGSASLISDTGQMENTLQMRFSPTTLNCSPPA